MERGPVISPAFGAVVRHRVKAAFLIAMEHGGAKRLRGPGWRGVVSDEPTGRVAFAAPGAAPPVAPNWSVIGWEPPALGSWSEVEFVGMTGRVAASVGPPLEGGRMTPDRRLDVARFIGRMFAPYASSTALLTYARALTRCEAIPLWAWHDGDRPLAAMLLTESGGHVGLHSLCVAPEVRGQGWGRRLLATAQRIAGDRPLALTCRPELAGWYESAGLNLVGALPLYRPRAF